MTQHVRSTTHTSQRLADLGPARDAALRGLVRHVNLFHRGVAAPQRSTPSPTQTKAPTSAYQEPA